MAPSFAIGDMANYSEKCCLKGAVRELDKEKSQLRNYFYIASLNLKYSQWVVGRPLY